MPDEVFTKVDPFELGLYDAALSGWFNNDTGELMAGCPIGPDDVVLDVGCGDAGVTDFCARRGARIIITDVNGERLAEAAKRLSDLSGRQVEFYETDSDPLPLPSESVTRVVCTEVLEHVDDPAALVAELARVGRPGALYVISVPDPVQEGLQKHLAPAVHFQKPNHIHVFEREEFAELLRGAGLTIERRYYYGYFWAVFWLLFWQCQVPLDEAASHPVLQNWTRTWQSVLDCKDGLRTKRLLDRFMPKSQLIIARKPAHN
jgi:2-polyprenyl-3-methyl-5-hydroxy-6-metoxy-1,4-benzoquinol methylase